MKKIISLFLVTIMLITALLPMAAVGEGNEKTVNRFNVVLVIDASLSMKDSDAKNNRFEATDLFLGMLANDGNYVGTVSFNGDVRASDLIEVNDLGSKRTLSKSIRGAKLDNDTNIGGALFKATEMIKANGKKGLPSLIILLSDGKTDFTGTEGEEKKLQTSKEQKETALETARDNGYTICTVSLNNDAKANNTELKNIAKATEGGMFEQVNDPNDLKAVFDKFYTRVYGTQSTKLADETIGSNGKITKDFTITDAGVEEVNIAVFGNVDKCSVTQPDGKVIEGSELEKIIFAAKSFKIIKLVNPQKGEWDVSVNGKPGSNITVVKTYNVNLTAKNEVLNPSKTYPSNKSIGIQTKLYEDNNALSSAEQYGTFKATLTVTDKDGNTVYETVNENATQNGFEFSFTPEKIGTYFANISVEGEEVFADTEELSFNVGNTTPVVVEETIEKHINIWPFLIKTDSTIDLAGAAKDNEDKTLTYQVQSATWDEKDYTINGDKLTIDSFKNVSKGSFKIQAIDSLGAFCTFNVKVTSTNIGLLAMILILAAILIAIIVIAIVTYILLNKAFMGEVTVSNLETRQSYTPQKSRGRIKLSSCPIGNAGFDKNAYFQATGKDYIYFISKKPVYGDTILNKSKKVKIDSNFDTVIYADSERTKGIEVRFNSYKNSIF